MNLTQIEAFCMVAQVKSMSEGARQLHISQSSLSYQIQLLETDLGVELFTRTTKGVELTEAGEIVYEYGQTFLKLQENLKADLASWKQGQEKLLVGASSNIGSYALPCAIYSFKEKHPHANIRLVVGNRKETLQRLSEKSVDMCLVEGPIDDPQISACGLAEDELLLIVNPDWQGPDTITLEQLRQLPLILREEGSGTRDIIENAIKEKGLTLKDFHVVLELNSNDAIKSAIEARHGVSLLSKLAVRSELHSGSLKGVKVEDLPLRTQISVLHFRNRPQSDLMKKFARFILSNRKAFC